MRQVAVITGASRGIGEAIAYKLASENMDIVLFGRDNDKLNNVKSKCEQKGVKVLSFSGDVADKDFVEESIRKVESEFGKVDHLINNAGVAVFKEFVDTSLEEFQLQVNTNIYGVFNFSKAVLNGMIENNRGSIINISSLAGKNGFKMGSTYAATKHAVMGFTRSLMLEVRDKGIRVAAICPGSVVTDMIINSELHPKSTESLLEPSDVAETVYSVLKLPARALVSEIEIRPASPK
jgi:3-oxoacyl-[acyl-carrier protein] reductase